MKASKTKYFIIAAIFLCALFELGSIVLSPHSANRRHIGGDMDLRRNEILCAHQGVNAFRIWSHEITLPGFVPWNRPDMEQVEYSENDAKVHAYPPWHTTMFWFYGWLSRDVCLGVMSIIFGMCLCFIGYEGVELAKERFKDYRYIAAFSLILITGSAVMCYYCLNYGVLILAMFLLMNKALKHNHDILAGLAWAVMMIKPQVGFLFVWPLFWQKRYLTIVTAAVVCLAATVGTSILVHESVIDLILQVPEIGRPYILTKIQTTFGSSAIAVISASFFVFVGFSTWLLRKNHDFLVSCVPAVLTIPLWSYTNNIGYDWVIFLPAYILLIGRMSEMRRFDVLSWVSLLFCFAMIFMPGYLLYIARHFFPSVNSTLIDHIANFSYRPLMLILSILFVYEKHKELRAAGGEACKAC